MENKKLTRYEELAKSLMRNEPDLSKEFNGVSQRKKISELKIRIENGMKLNSNLIKAKINISKYEREIEHLTTLSAIDDEYFLLRKYQIERRDELANEIDGIEEINVEAMRKEIKQLIKNN